MILLPAFSPLTLRNALTAGSLTGNLVLCLDAADPQSYPGSGQSWLDRSGNGYDFFLGGSGSVTAADPVWTGGNPNYWAFDGNQFFTYDTTNETWMENLHKNNALFSAAFFYYQDGSADTFPFFSDYQTLGTQIGAQFLVNNTRQIRFTVANSGTVITKTADTALGAGAWHMVGISLNEATGAGGGFIYSDGAYNQVSASDTFDATYTSPSSSGATQTFGIGAIGGAAGPASDGQRLSCGAMWTSALSKANFDTLWALMRGRFGI